MNILTLLVAVAVLATLYSMAAGIISMAAGHEVGHRTSEQWMVWRVVAQGSALLLILLMLLAES